MQGVMMNGVVVKGCWCRVDDEGVAMKGDDTGMIMRQDKIMMMVMMDGCGGPGIEVDLLPSRDADNPCEKDWSTCGTAAGNVSFGFLVHSILPRTYNHALPKWHSLLPNDDGRRGDDIDRQRQKLQKKGWRSKCVFASREKRQRILRCCYLGAPLERLMATLQHRDVTGKLLLDLAVFNDRLNPVHVCHLDLSAMLQDGPAGPLGPLFDYVQEHEAHDFMADIRDTGMDFISAVKC